MQKFLFKNILLVNEGSIRACDVLVNGERIEKIADSINIKAACTEIEGHGRYLMPGIIDDQVHFRDPGLTHKGDIHTESRAGLAGGVTSFMDMPNTIPNALTLELLEEKYALAAHKSMANYSFFMGVSNDNATEVLKINDRKKEVCGIKIFMGSSTGNMLVDKEETLRQIFRESDKLIALHCEKEEIIKKNLESIQSKGIEILPEHHPVIRNVEACSASSSMAIELAQQFDTRLHILHISTATETELFRNDIPLIQKRITAEVCVHHLHFTSEDYPRLGYQIKCNPAIKSPENKAALWKALLDDRLDIIATDHAPHLLSEKGPDYFSAHAGLPLIQHSLQMMLHYQQQGLISLEQIVRKMSHAVADCFGIIERGYIREGYFADLVLLDLNRSEKISKENILYKCGWSPLEGQILPGKVTHTMVNGRMMYANGRFDESHTGKRLQFQR